MQCEAARQQIIDGLTDAPAEQETAVEEHLATCAACRAERAALAEMWQTLGCAEGPIATAADSARMRLRLDAMVDACDAGRTAVPLAGERQTPRRVPHPSWRGYALQAAAILVIFSTGLVVGRDTTRPTSAPELETLRQELRDLRQVVTLSLMQQQSASDRLKGVSWSGQIDAPSNDVVQALIDTSMRDPNVNVRLAGIDALERFADRQIVRRAAMEAVQAQLSPLVQIALIDFLVRVNERGSLPILKQIVGDPQAHEAVRARASWGLRMLG